MIGYATIGTNDLEKASKFYDAVLAPLGGGRTFANGDRRLFSGRRGTWALMGVTKPSDAPPAPAAHGTMFGLPAESTEQVDAVHAAALAAGGACDGPPGQRLPTFYGAYFRDLDGNKVCVFKMG